MDTNEFLKHARRALCDIAEYYEDMPDKAPHSTVKPGYLYRLLPLEAPEEPESFDAIHNDMETKIVPGITHWQSGNFFGWYPASNSFPAMLGDMYSSMFSVPGFNWICSPAATELETVVTDWLGKLIGLDKRFRAINDDGTECDGGGIIQETASDAILLSMIGGRQRVLERLRAEGASDDDIARARTKLVAYFSDQTHSCGEKATMVIGCKVHTIESDRGLRLTADALRAAVAADKAAGLIPFFVCGTFGTTNTAAIDDLSGIAEIAADENMWYHVDAAYAGAALCCPEFRPLARGIEAADAFVFNTHKWMLTGSSCSVLWVADSTYQINALNLEREYLPRVRGTTSFAKDYHRWEIPLGHRFRSLKLWFMMRMYGAAGIRAHIRGHVDEAKWLEGQLLADGRFEIAAPVVFGLVVFRIHPDVLPGGGLDAANAELLRRINADGRVFLVGTKLKGVQVLRAAIGATMGSHENTRNLLAVLKEVAAVVIAESSLCRAPRARAPLQPCLHSAALGAAGIAGQSRSYEAIAEALPASL